VILGAALLVLVALGLFVGGILTGLTTLYWACVALSAVAAVLLVVARRRLARPPARVRAPVRSDSASAEAEQVSVQRERPPVEPARTATLPVQPPAESVPDAAEHLEPGPERFAPPPEQVAAPRHASPAEDEAAPGGATAVGASSRHAGDGASSSPRSTDAGPDGEPPVEEVEVTDLLLVVDLHDDVVVVDEHPRYHLPECPFLRGRTSIPLPIDEARTDGFTPCGLCSPDRHLAQIERARRAARRSP
jgi:hypothetical protein